MSEPMTTKVILTKEAARLRIGELHQKIKDHYVSATADIQALATEMLQLASESGLTDMEGVACLELSLYYCSVANEYKTSLDYAEKGFQLLKGEAKAYYAPYYHLNKGRCFQFMGDQIKAQEEYLEAISQLEKKRDKSVEETRWMGSSYYNAYILFNQGGMEYSREDFLEKAYELYQNIDDKPGLSNCYNSLASLSYKKGELDTTLNYLLKAYDLSKELKAYNHMSIFTSNIGLVYAQLGDARNFREYFQLAAEHTRKTKSRFHEAHMNGQMAEALMFLGIYEESLDRLKTAEDIFSDLGAMSSLTSVYKKMAEIFAAQGDFQKAYEAHVRYANLIKERFNDEKAAAIMKARMLFEIEEKENEAQLLKDKNAEIEKYMNKLKASNNELQQFAYIVSHDLREPLRTISTYIRLLEKSMGGRLDKEEQEFIDFVVSGSKNMNELISDLLTFSKISFVTDTEMLDLNSLVRLVADETRLHYLPEKNAVVSISNLPDISGNRTHLKQLFGNLISNAIKYNKHAEPSIIIHCESDAQFHTFTVSDDGIGIAPEFRDRVFQIFQRLHTKSEYHGTGIGLAIVKKIIENMGGNITLRGNDRKGSDFIFTLPK